MKKRVRPKHVVKFDPRDPAVVKAISIVKPNEDDRVAFSRDVVSAMRSIGDADVQRTWTALETSKDGKLAAKKLLRALQHVERVCKDKTIELPAPLMLNPFVLNNLVALAERCEAVRKTPSAPKPQRAAEAMRDAVHHAHDLMEKYTTDKILTKADRAKLFCQLAAVLLNNSEVKLSGRRVKAKEGLPVPLRNSSDVLAAHCERYVRDLKKAEKRGPK